jgi:hypothetical protein
MYSINTLKMPQLTLHKKARRPYSATEKVRINPSLGAKSTEVVLYPHLTGALIGIVEDGKKVRALYGEEEVIKIFISEGMERGDAKQLSENHKNRQGRDSPLFVKTGFSK